MEDSGVWKFKVHVRYTCFKVFKREDLGIKRLDQSFGLFYY